jgi:hypothetical protein
LGTAAYQEVQKANDHGKKRKEDEEYRGTRIGPKITQEEVNDMRKVREIEGRGHS